VNCIGDDDPERRLTLSEIYEYAARYGVLDDVPTYSRTESTVDLTTALYRQQMTDLAAQGDRFARRVCEDHGWAYEVPQDASNEESVALRQERSCVEKEPHDPHVWTRLGFAEDGKEVQVYTCPGVAVT